MKTHQHHHGILGRWGLTAGATALVLILVISAFGMGTSVRSAPPAASSRGGITAASTPPSVTISDGETAVLTQPVHTTLRDSITFGASTSGSRSYTIDLLASDALANVSVAVDSHPIVQWGLPNQLPGGGDNLPPLDLWTWTVTDNGVNVTSQWTATSWDQQLSGDTSWTNQTIRVRGSTAPEVNVSVNPSELDGTFAPSVGFVVNSAAVPGGLPANDTTLTATAAALDPAVVRFDTITAETVMSWNTKTNQPRFNFTYFDNLANFSRTVGAGILLSLPAGTWGDGNLLPGGMPLNKSIAVPGSGGVGYFPQNAAYVAYVEGIVNHSMGADEHISYWTIGNEFPTNTLALVTAYTNLFNLAAETIHSKLPNALVGSDVMTNITYEPYFAAHARNVGFLSFHYYPSLGLCVVNGTYCPPQGSPLGSTDVGLLAHPAYTYMGRNNAPGTAQGLWYNATRHWLPIFNAETNINGVGGSVGTASNGTDPRMQTLFGASWVTSLLIDSAFQNVSEVTYFDLSSGWETPNTVTSPYGGWGYGLTSETAAHTNTLYAPYFALELWGEAFGVHSPGVWTNTSSASTVHSYAALQGSNLSVVLENRVNVPVSIHVNVTGSAYTLVSVTTIERPGYEMVYQPTAGDTVLSADGMHVTTSSHRTSVTLAGYGVAVAKYVLTVDSVQARSSGGTPPHQGAGRSHGAQLLKFTAVPDVGPVVPTMRDSVGVLPEYHLSRATRLCPSASVAFALRPQCT